MKLKLFFALAVGSLMLPAATFAQAAFVAAPRIFPENDPGVYGPLREQYSRSANTEVQVQLTLLGYYHGPIDGKVNPGSPTSIAITAYQRGHRLPVTGTIDGNLLASLNGQQ